MGPHGSVEGELRAAQVLVAGVVVGKLVATERVTLLPSARVRGTVQTPWLDVRTGAQLEAAVTVWRD